MSKTIANKTIALGIGAAVFAFILADAPSAEAQYATIIETTTPERKIPPPREVRGREHRANNPYFGLKSSYSNVRQYYSNPVKTIPPQTRRTVILNYPVGYPYYGGYPAYQYQVGPRYPYGYGYPWGVRRW